MRANNRLEVQEMTATSELHALWSASTMWITATSGTWNEPRLRD
jgi:hypothetical protein